MARQFNILLIGTIAIGCVVGAGIAWSNVAGPVGGQVNMTKAAFDQAFADATPSQTASPGREKLRDAGLKRINGQRLLQAFWVAAIASPYLGAKNAELLRPLNHMFSLQKGKFGIVPDSAGEI
jgi:hypothetical protein